MPDDLSYLLSPASLNGLELKNRIIKAATFEGMTPQGIPGEALRKFHCRFADGGVAMTTIAYCAAEPDGRLNRNTMHMGEHLREPLIGIVDTIHRAGAAVSGQLVHCGGFTKNRERTRRHVFGPSLNLNRLGAAYGMPIVRAMSHRDIDDAVEAFGRAAAFMKSAGFDCIELHLGHGYGLCQFLSPKTNRRTDEYGGALVNRLRYPLRVLEAIRDAVGDDFPIIGKISMDEGANGGITLSESIEIARALDQAGIDGIVTSTGSSTMNPMLMFRGDDMSKEMLKHERNPLVRLGMRVMRSKMFGDYPFSENYLRDDALRIRDAVSCKVIYIGGACSAASMQSLIRDGFDFVQIGRALLADPDLPKNLANDPDYINRCTHCNKCVAYIEHPDGIRCVL